MSTDETANRIVVSALTTFLKRGVKRSSVTDVAFEAGFTRITLYRYFGDKKGLVAAVCGHVAQIFRKAADGTPTDAIVDIDARLKRLGEDLGRLPPGNLLAQFDEIHRLYPEVYEEFRATRESAIDQIFEQAVNAATREHAIREGINLQVVKAMFRASVMGLIENPTLIAANIPLDEICKTVTAVLRHGIVRSDAAHEPVAQTMARGSDHE